MSKKLLEDNFHSKSRSWRKQTNHLQGQLICCTDITTLQTECHSLEECMQRLTGAHEELEMATESSVEKIALFNRFEAMSKENNLVLQNAYQAIRNLKLDIEDDRSMVSQRSGKSHTSRKSCRSGATILSRGSTSSSNRQRRQELEEGAAALKARMRVVREKEEANRANNEALQAIQRKLQAIEEEEKRVKDQIQLTNERFKLQEELAEAEARIEVCARFDGEEDLSFINENNDIPRENGAQDHLERFLQSQQPDNQSSGEAILHGNQAHNESSNERSRVSESSPAKLNQDATQYIPAAAKNSTLSQPVQGVTSPNILESHLSTLTKILESQNQSRLPLPKPEVFNGDPLKFQIWLKAFETLIETRAVNPTERLHFLGRYVGGEAKDVIDGFMLMNGEDAYQGAKQMLLKRYGDPFAVASAFRRKLEAWPQIQPQDGLGLRRYADFLVQCEKAMTTVESLKALNDDKEIQKMSSKLPKWAINRWGRKIYEWKNEKKTFPPFSEFVKYVVIEAEIACDPINLGLRKPGEDSKGLRRSKDKILPRLSPRGRNASESAISFAAQANERTEDQNTPEQQRCLLCGQNHDLESCKDYVSKDISGRKELVKSKGLCFGCLGQGHLSKDCKQRKKCNTCSKAHPTSLHGDVKDNSRRAAPQGSSQNQVRPNQEQTVQNRTSFATNTDFDGKVCSMIVPVWVHHKNNPDRAILVYAVLDDQSDTTFVSEKTLDHLGVEGHATQISLSTMHSADEVVQTSKVNDLIVSDFKRGVQMQLPRAFSCDDIPVKRSQIPRPEIAMKWNHLKNIANKFTPHLPDVEIGLLIGANCPRAIVPRQVIPGRDNEPYAERTELGWGIVGNVINCEQDADEHNAITHRLVTQPVVAIHGRERACAFRVTRQLKEVINPQHVRHMMESDFSERNADNGPISLDDVKFLDQLKNGIQKTQNGHYEMPLPFRTEMPELPNNKLFALRRLQGLKARLQKDQRYRQHYTTFMKELLDKGYAQPVPDNERESESKQVWYIPHHGIYHPQKPEKLRVVFDCSASYRGESLNQHLLQGPDQMNGLIGVLTRFRQYPIAFSCDVEGMFHQFQVNAVHRNYLRFLWWEEGDTSAEPKEYRMTVHLFGATSSPGCANYGLKAIAEDNKQEFGEEVANFVKRDFYVDDGLKSVKSVPEAVTMIQKTKDMLAKGGLRLHKFVSNSKEVLSSISPDDRASNLKDLDFTNENLPIERTLGIQWCIESDSFNVRITLQDKPFTRRGILSTISSIYDPLGFVAPLLLIGRQILQELCRDQAEWDDPVPDELRRRWEKFRSDLLHLDKMEVPRCLAPAGFEDVTCAELHHFADASTTGYGQCSYIRLVNRRNQVHCALVMGKSRVAPLKHVTIPRLELSAAVVAVKVSSTLTAELSYQNIVNVFWIDSKVALGYIGNDARRFHVFVANRVQQIRNVTNPDQWNFVESDNNPADDASRGLSAEQLAGNSRWLTGPEFLWKEDFQLPIQEIVVPSEEDPEVKRIKSFAAGVVEENRSSILDRLNYFSCWYRTKRAIANCVKLKNRLKRRACNRNSLNEQTANTQEVNVDDLRQSENLIIRLVQEREFPEEMKILRSLQREEPTRKEMTELKASLKKASCLYRLDPFLDSSGVLRVGGRLRRSDLPYHIKHPVILPRKSHVTTLIIRHHHEKISHQGRGMTLSELRASGYWIIGGSSSIGYHIANCVACQRCRGQVQEQKMADLPSERMEVEAPFTYCAVDYFGPWYIKEGRKEMKRYGVLFTCLSSRAIHLEVAKTLETDSFINVLRCFLARRGPIRQLRSDQGTNLVGARVELRNMLNQMDQKEVRNFLLKQECDWFEFKLNTPTASHAGGVWERMIRTVRSALDGLLEKHGTQLDEESLRTLLCEAECIVNSRPIVRSSNPEDEPLTPNHILTMKSRVLMPPPGEFQRNDVYLTKRWKRVQYLANCFWEQWRKRYLMSLQERQKWSKMRRNVQKGDIVLLKDDTAARNNWKSARVEEAYVDEDGLVRNVKVVVGDAHLNKKGERQRNASVLKRPIQKIVVILKSEENDKDSPPKS